MKKNISLQINKPCAEKFSDFQPTHLGGFCQSCQKEVIDFTNMSDQEIIEHFKNNSGKTCGRFLDSQLKTYHETIPLSKKRNFQRLGAGLLSFSLASFLSLQNSQAQSKEPSKTVFIPQEKENHLPHAASQTRTLDYTVKGIVTDEDGFPIIGVNVILKDSFYGTITDVEGKFTFPAPLKKGDILLFSFVGFEAKKYEISDESSDELSITLKLFSCVTMGQVVVNQVYQSKPSFWQKVKGIFR